MKRLFILFLSLLLLVQPVFADEIKEESTEESIKGNPDSPEGRLENGTGNKLTSCLISISLADMSGEYPNDKITMDIVDSTTVLSGSYELVVGDTTNLTVSAPANYTDISFKDLDDSFSIITSSNNEDLSFTATSNGSKNYSWAIIKKGEETEKIIDEEAEKIYKDFVSATYFIKDSEDWQDVFLSRYNSPALEDTYAGEFSRCVAGASKEEYTSMNLYDRFLWYETYVVFAADIKVGKFANYFGSKENYEDKITSRITDRLEKYQPKRYKEVEEAYIALTDWQYDYIQKYGYPYNFINQRTYLEEEAAVQDEEGHMKPYNEEDYETTVGSESETLATKEDEEETEEEEAKEEEGIWTGVMNSLAGSLVSIAIAGVLFCVLACIYFFRKRYNQ